MQEPKVSSLVKLSILCLLNENKRHGYEIIKSIGKNTDKKISAGEVYPFLKTLKDHGLVSIEYGRPRNKKIYSLTKAGKKFAKSIFKRFDTIIDSAIKEKISVCRNCGCKIYDGSFIKKTNGIKRVFCCKYCAGRR